MKHKLLLVFRQQILSLLLCAGLVLSFTACKSDMPEERQPGVTYTDLIADMNREMVSGLTNVMPQILWCGEVDGRLFAYGADETDPANPTPHLLADIDPGNETFTYTALQLPDAAEDMPGFAAALAAGEAAGGHAEQDAKEYDVPDRAVTGVMKNEAGQLCLVLCDTLYHYGQDARGNTTVAVTERAVRLCALGESGSLQPLAVLQLPEEYRLLSNVAQDCLPGADNTLWVSATDLFGGQAHLLRFSMTDGRLVSTLSLPEGVIFRQGNVLPLGGEKLGVLARPVEIGTGIPQDDVQLYVAEDLAGDSPDWQRPVDLPPSLQKYGDSIGFASSLVAEEGQGDLLFCTAEGISSWDLQAENPTQLLAWKDYGVHYQDMLAVFSLRDGRYALCTQTDTVPSAGLTMLTPLDPNVVAQRTVLTLGTLNYSALQASDAIGDIVAKFNATSDEYYIQVIDYEEMAAEQGLGMLGGADVLSNAVIDGDVPDILMLQTGAHKSLLEKGLTIDLYPYIDADPELAREDFLPNMLGFTEIDGKLASVLAAYTLSTLAGNTAEVGETPGWTWEEYQALCKAVGDPTPIWRMSRSVFLSFCGVRLFVDTQSRQAHFDTPDFVALLEASAAYPELEQVDWDAFDPRPEIADGTVHLVEMSMSEWYNLADPLDAFPDGYTLKGYPSDGSSNGCVIADKLQLGISRTCEHPDAAWQFLRLFLLPEFQDLLGNDASTYPGFSVRQDSLTASAKIILPRLRAGTLRSSYWPISSEMTPEMYVKGDEQDIEKVLDIIRHATIFNNFDSTIHTILTEEAEAYYSGQRSAEETARIIQNRVQTYLDEQG